MKPQATKKRTITLPRFNRDAILDRVINVAVKAKRPTPVMKLYNAIDEYFSNPDISEAEKETAAYNATLIIESHLTETDNA